MKKFYLIAIFLTAAGLGYSLSNYFFGEESNLSLVIIMACFFVVSVAGWQRLKITNNQKL